MHGNVREWCLDWFGFYSEEAQIDPLGPALGSSRGERGGDFGIAAQYVRSAFRNYASPGSRYSPTGFRLLRMENWRPAHGPDDLSVKDTIDRLLEAVAAFHADAQQSDEMTCVAVRVGEESAA